MLWKKVMPRLVRRPGPVGGHPARSSSASGSGCAFRSAALLGPRRHLPRADGQQPSAATLVALDGDAAWPPARDFDDDRARSTPGERHGARRGRRPAALAAGLDRPTLHRARRSTRSPAGGPGAALHDLDAAAGGQPQAALRRPADDARRPGPVRARLHHLHAHRLHHAVRRGRYQRPRGARSRELYGDEYVPDAARAATTSKVKNAQEAHEAIRPAGESLPHARRRRPASCSGDELRALRADLEAHRRLADGRRHRDERPACGWSAARRARRRGGRRPSSRPSGNVITFPGFLRGLRRGHRRPRGRARRPARSCCRALAEGERVGRRGSRPTATTTQPPARYTEASLVKKLEELGVGRPSTYASIIGHDPGPRLRLEEGHGARCPTFTAFAVMGLLEQHFADLVDYGFTAAHGGRPRRDRPGQAESRCPG